MSVSDLYDDAVQVNCPVTFEKFVDVLQQWKHLCVGMTFKKNLSSCKISQNVCTKFVLEIIYSNYLRSVCPNIRISIFVWKFQLFKIYILNLNCKLTLQSLFFWLLLFSKCQIRTREKTQVIKNASAKASVLTCTTVCQDYTFPLKCLKWSF